MPDSCTCTSKEIYCSHCQEAIEYGMALARERMWHTQGDELQNFAESFEEKRLNRLQKKLNPLSCIQIEESKVNHNDYDSIPF